MLPPALRLHLFFALASVSAFANTDVAAQLSEAHTLFTERRYAEAQPLFEAVIVADPTNTDALMHLGKLAAKRRERELAVDYLQRAVDLAPDDAELQFEYGAACGFHADALGSSFRALRSAHRCRKAMERAVELAPDNLIFRQGLLEFYASAPGIAGGSMRKAFEQADAIAARNAVQGTFARANLQRLEHDFAGALTTLGALLDHAPDNYFALYQFGRCAAESGLELDRGLAALRHCLALPAPDKGAPPAEVWWRIGQIQSHRGQLDDARTSLQTAATLAPNDQRIAQALGNLAPEA